LDSAEETNDRIEQDQLQSYIHTPLTETNPGPSRYAEDLEDEDIDMEGDGPMDGNEEDDEGNDLGDGDEELEDDDMEFMSAGAGAGADPDIAATTIGSLHRFVHTNGLHHMAMISCQCKGEEVLALDLFALHLLPASLKRIKTLFTAQVLDMFRLSNLELKASAYQFHQLLRRLTRPMAPAEVPNLYREFRRMTRIWRWMKKLKWAGYAGSSKKVKDVAPGELAIFCAACPQPGINIPDNWREDVLRHVKFYLLRLTR
jgi:hypothetical protein